MATEVVDRFKIQVDDAGSPVISAVTKRFEELHRKAGDATGGLSLLNKASREATGIFAGFASEGAGLLGRLGPLALSFGGVATAVLAVGAVTMKGVEAFTRFTKEVRDLSYVSGASTRDVSVLVNGLDQLGVDSDAVQTGINKMSAAITSGDPVINRLGLSIRDASGHNKNAVQLFYETVDALGRMTDATTRNALAREIFGRGWMDLVPVLARGSKAIQELGEHAGKSVSPDDIERVREFDRRWRQVKETVEAAAVALGRVALTMITPPTGGTVDLAERARLFGQLHPGTAPSGGFSSDVGAWRLGMPGVSVSGAEAMRPNIQELQRAVQQAEIRQMLAGASLLRATGPGATGRAQEDLLVATMNTELAKLALEAGPTGLTAMDDEKQRAIVERTRAAISKLTRENIEHLAQMQMKAFLENAAAEASDLANAPPTQRLGMSADAWRAMVDNAPGILAQRQERENLIRWLRANNPYPDETEKANQVIPLPYGSDLAPARYRRTLNLQYGVENALNDRLGMIGAQSAAYGPQHFDALTAQIDATREALDKMLLGMKDMSGEEQARLGPRLDELKKRFADLTGEERTRQTLRETFASITDGVTEAVRGVQLGTQTMSQAFSNMGLSIALSVQNTILKRALEPLENALADLAMNLARSGLSYLFPAPAYTGTYQSPFAGGQVAMLKGYGGVFPGSFMPVHAFSSGGIASRPTLGLIAERGQREAVVPLPDGKSIPVSGVGATEVHLHMENRTGVPLNMKEIGRRRDGKAEHRTYLLELLATDPGVRQAVGAARG